LAQAGWLYWHGPHSTWRMSLPSSVSPPEGEAGAQRILVRPKVQDVISPMGFGSRKNMAKVAPSDHAESQVEIKSLNLRETSGRSLGSSTRLELSSTPRQTSFVPRSRYLLRRALDSLGWYDSAGARALRIALKGRAFATIAMVALFLALFLGDLFTLLQVSTNTEQDVILTVVFAVFVLEFFGLMLIDVKYFLGFFWWMDLLGTASMVFDISYMAGADATEPQVSSSSTNSVVLIRATRAAKLGARAGRLSRVVKLLRFLPLLYGGRVKQENTGNINVAAGISNQLTNDLSMHVAFITIMVVMAMPLVNLFSYPEDDVSMIAWTTLLAKSAQDYLDALNAGDASLRETLKHRLFQEVERCSSFYSSLTYGPFAMEFGQTINGVFQLQPDILDLNFYSHTFTRPRRASSIQQLTSGRIATMFDLSQPRQAESAAGMGLIVLVIMVMICFGLIMSSSVSTAALKPLEKILAVIRYRCAKIFKYTKILQEDAEHKSEYSENREQVSETDEVNEFELLERVVAKLAAIASLTTDDAKEKKEEEMNESDIMVLNWTQGARTTAFFSPVQTQREKHPAIPGSTSEEPCTLATPRSDSSFISTVSTVPKEVVDELEDDHFNSLDLSRDMRLAVAAHMLQETEGCTMWQQDNVPQAQLHKWLSSIDKQYPNNPFHNAAHALDVQYTTRRFLQLIEADGFMKEYTIWGLLIAAIGHDIGHLAVNNSFLVETAHELALQYNDQAPLENMHCAKLFKAANEPDANIFVQLQKDLYKEVRKIIIDAILHTDVTKHNDMIKELSLLYQMNSESFDALEPGPVVSDTQGHMQLVVNFLLHCADLGNPMKPWPLCQRIAYLLLEEFFAQGDKEKEKGIPVQMLNDREKVNRANSQIGFIEFVIAPMVESLVNVFPHLDRLAHYLGENIEHWEEIWKEASEQPPDMIIKVEARVQKVVDSCTALMWENKVQT